MSDDDERLPFKDFDARLEQARGRDPSQRPAAPAPSLNWGSGLQIGIELVAGVIGGLLIGWALDRWLATRPLFLIVFFLLGAVAGMLNAFRRLQRVQGGGDGPA